MTAVVLKWGHEVFEFLTTWWCQLLHRPLHWVVKYSLSVRYWECGICGRSWQAGPH